jgi:DnaJ family protein C protein 17
MEITWVNNKEPLILGWLKKMGKLSAVEPSSSSSTGGAPNPAVDSNPTSDSSSTTATPMPFGAPAGSTPFSSFPNLAATSSWSTPSFSFPGTGQGAGMTATAPGLDYESLTMLRLRQAERERLEREIREREAEEEKGT